MRTRSPFARVRLGPVVAAVLVLSGAVPAALRAQPSPQVTSEIPCTEDSACPAHNGLCFASFLPGCGCDEGRGRCDPNPKSCATQADCFGQEVCSSEDRCVEPGGERAGQLCNVDDDCRPWLRCRGGSCGATACAVDGDCAEGLTCQDTLCRTPVCESNQNCPLGQLCRENPQIAGDFHCVNVLCGTDADCGDLAACRDGACRAVECRASADCRGCELCEVGNSCVSRCEDDQRCASFVALDPGTIGFATFVSRCVDRSSRACTSDFNCDRGQRCLGGRCIRAPEILRDLDPFLRRPPDRDQKPQPDLPPTDRRM